MFPSTFVEMRTQNSKFLAGHPGLRDRVMQTFLPCLQNYTPLSVFHNVLEPTPDNPYLPNGLPFKLHNQVQTALEGQATDLWDSK